MLLRVGIAASLGIVVAFLLFWGMQALISVEGELTKGRADPKVEFVRLRRDTTPQAKEREPPKREKPEQPPPPPQMNMAKNINPGEAVGEIAPLVDTSAEIAAATDLSSGAGSDRGITPLVRVDPEYPPRAKQRGIEGYVDMEFTIGPSGTVGDAFVVNANPSGIFEDAALRAVRRWRYNPKIVDGKPVSRSGVRVRLRFTLGS